MNVLNVMTAIKTFPQLIDDAPYFNSKSRRYSTLLILSGNLYATLNLLSEDVFDKVTQYFASDLSEHNLKNYNRYKLYHFFSRISSYAWYRKRRNFGKKKSTNRSFFLWMAENFGSVVVMICKFLISAAERGLKAQIH